MLVFQTCYIQDVEIKHYTLSGTIFGHLSHPPNPYWTGWLYAHVSLTFDGILNVYRLMLNEEGWKINTAECLRGRRGFRIFESTRRYFHSLQKNIQASLILFHSFIRIIETASLRYSRSEKTNKICFFARLFVSLSWVTHVHDTHEDLLPPPGHTTINTTLLPNK